LFFAWANMRDIEVVARTFAPCFLLLCACLMAGAEVLGVSWPAEAYLKFAWRGFLNRCLIQWVVWRSLCRRQRLLVFLWQSVLAVWWYGFPTLHTHGTWLIFGDGGLGLRRQGDVTRFRAISPFFRRPLQFITVPLVLSLFPLPPTVYCCL
jgi:hypothetical protein